MFSYRKVLGQAWKITKQYKKLWIFGFLAFLLSAGGEYKIITKLLNEEYGAGVYEKMVSSSIFLSPVFWADLYQLCLSNPKEGIAILLMIIMMAAVLFGLLWVCIRSQIALVKWTKNYLNSKNTDKKPSVWEELSTKDRSFWRVLGINILIDVVITFAFTLLSLPLILLYFQDSNLAILAYTIFFIIFLPLALSFSLIAKYAIVAIALEKKTLVASIENGCKLFKKNWLVSLEMALLLFLINFFIGLLGVLLLSAILLPIILTLLVFNLIFPLYLFVLVTFILLVIFAALLMTFQTASWTILYLELKNEGIKAKLERIFTSKKQKKAKK